jgi:hypothetical protein
MKKTYWWRILVLLLSGGVVISGLYYDSYLCFSSYVKDCLFDKYRLIFIEPAIIFFIALFIVSISLFFINDKVFIKWLRFAMIWVVLSIILIGITPIYSGGWVAINPDKETVSIWMGALFVILSWGKIGWDWRREKRAG